MRHGSSRRQRNRGGNGGSGRRGNQNRSQVFDSNGPDVRIRGTAHQVAEKYMALAKDAAASGDRIMHENYLQHAEHYQRVINSWGEDTRSNNQQKTGNEDGNVQKDSEQQEVKATKETRETEDLGLPASILGDAPVATENTEELTS